MIERIRSWLGAEPFLGITTLAVVLPLVALFAYAMIEGAISHPVASAIMIALLIATLFTARIADRVGERGRKIIRIFYIIAFAAYLAWMSWDDFVPWPGFTPHTIVNLLLFAFCLSLVVMVIQRQSNPESDTLPDYRQE